MTDKVAKSKEWMGAFEAFSRSFDNVIKNPKPALFFVGVYALFNIVSMLIQGVSTYSNNDYVPYADALMLVFVLPLTMYGLALADGKKLTVSEFMEINLKKLLFIILASLLLVLIVAGSLLLLILPAVWTIAWFAVATYIVVDKDMSPIDALKESKRISQRHKGKVWGIIGVSLLVSLAGAVLATIPYVGVIAVGFASLLSTVAAASLYRWLQIQAK